MRERDVVLRALLRAGFAAPEAGFARDVVFRVPVDRVAPLLDDFARAGVFFALVLLRAVEPLRAVDVRALPEDEPGLELALASPSIDHLPDITRCAASATASAMIDPSLVALDIMLLAACDAVSAASRPASRILRRAAGLALIAAAAAASPAASISLLIAAFANLSIVSFEREEEPEEEPEEVVFEDLAITLLPASRRKTL